jgi:hypothetical protein
VHTLVAEVDDDEHPMLTLFSIHGDIEYVDDDGDRLYIENAQSSCGATSSTARPRASRPTTSRTRTPRCCRSST